MSKCSKTRNALSQLEDTNKLIDTLVEAKLEQENPGYTKFVEESSDKLAERYSLDEVNNNLISEEDFDNEIEFKSDKDRVLTKIFMLSIIFSYYSPRDFSFLPALLVFVVLCLFPLSENQQEFWYLMTMLLNLSASAFVGQLT